MNKLYCTILHIATKKHLKATTIHVYMAAIRNLHILHGAQPPPAQAPRVKLALKAIYKSGPAPNRKYSITFTLLQSMLLSLSPNHDHIVWCAIMTLAWFGGLRSAEYTTISGSEPLVQHIQFGKIHSLSYMYHTITRSKTHVHAYQVPIGCARHEVCAVCAMKTYFKIRTCASTLYPSAPLFVFASGQVLTKSVLNSFIKSMVLQLGWDPTRFSSVLASLLRQRQLDFPTGKFSSCVDGKVKPIQQYIRNIQPHQISFAQRLSSP